MVLLLPKLLRSINQFSILLVTKKLQEMIFSILIIIFMLKTLPLVNGHGRLMDPPARSSAWRLGYNTPVNYDDNQLYCGGVQIQHGQNNGRCGVCGDPYNARRDNELPNGKYIVNPPRITGDYASGSVLEAKVELTTTHLGYFTFRLCPKTSTKREVSQECLNKYPLKVLTTKGNRETYQIKSEKSNGNYTVPLRLPPNVTCDRCVLQWTYTSGNTWGTCSNGTQETGCGPQETFRGCADIKIWPREGVHFGKGHYGS